MSSGAGFALRGTTITPQKAQELRSILKIFRRSPASATAGALIWQDVDKCAGTTSTVKNTLSTKLVIDYEFQSSLDQLITSGADRHLPDAGRPT